MPITQEPATALADSVKQDIKSIATTSEFTINLLRELLGLDLQENPSKKKGVPEPKKQIKVTAKGTAKAPARRIPATKSKSTPTFAIHDASDFQTSPLPLDRRRGLATEVFNATLKQLSDRLKGAQNRELLREGQSPKQIRSSPEKALQNRSPNRRVPVRTDLETGKAVSVVPYAVNGLKMTADCAMTALRCLDDISRGSTQSSVKPELSLIQGSQILLEKLLGLGLGEHAARQALQLRRQLDLLLNQSGGNSKSKDRPAAEGEKPSSDPGIMNALAFDDLPDDVDILKIISSFQIQVLKACLLLGSSFIKPGLPGLLQPSNSFGISAVILKLVAMKAMTPDKAGQQLHSVSQILSRICSSFRNQPSRSRSPSTITMKLMLIMLQIRCQSWKLLKHKADLERELWVPLCRTIQEYTEADGEKHPTNFQDLMDATLNLRALACVANQQERLPSSISNLLAELAQRCGSGPIALALLEEQYLISPSPSSLVEVILHCKIATLHLSMDSTAITARLQTSERALESLGKSVKGTPSELKELLLHGARLRKAATAVAVEIEKSIKSGNVGQQEIGLQTCVIRLTYAIQRFTLRYLSQGSGSPNGDRTRQRWSDDEVAISRSARNTVDAVILMAKCSMVRLPLLWPDTEAALKGSTELARLITTISSLKPDNDLKGASAPSVCLKISNLYWGWYLQSKDSVQKPRESCALLERSVAALEECPDAEQRQSFCVVRYERLASLYLDIKSYEKAQQVLRCAIDASIRQGALDEAVKITSARPSRFAWNEPKLDAHLLGSCLRKYARNALNLNLAATDPAPFYDNDTLPDLHRAKILERQLFGVSDQPLCNAMRYHLVTMAEQILSLLQNADTLCYRLQFIRDALSVAAKYPQFPAREFLWDKLIQNACTCEEVFTAEICLLSPYNPLLRASVQLQWAFLTTRPSPAWLQQVVDVVNSEISQATANSKLASVIDDSEAFLRQLQAVADYAGMLDLVSLRLDVLTSMRKILQHCNANEPQRLASCVTHIAILQNRLGNTIAAGRTFAEAENLMAKAESISDVKLLHGLSYAEYLNDLANIAKSIEVMTATFQFYKETLVQNDDSESGSGRFKRESHLAHATLNAATLTFRQGDLASAIKYARQCVRLTSGLWASLEKLCEGFRDNIDLSGSESIMHTATEETIDSALSIDHSKIQAVNKGVSFWSHVHLHFRALLRMSSLSAHCGLCPDAIYYAEQARKLSTRIACENRKAIAQSALAVLHARSGLHSEARKDILSAKGAALHLIPIAEACEISLNLAMAAIALGDFTQAESYLQNAEFSLNGSIDGKKSQNVAKTLAPMSLEKQMNKLTMKETKVDRVAKSTSKSMKQKAVVVPKGRTLKKTTLPTSPCKTSLDESLSPTARMLHEKLATLRIQLQICSLDPTPDVLETIGTKLQGPTATTMTRSFMDATLMVMQAMALFGSDAVHCVLAETALAFPSKYTSRRPSGRVSALSASTVATKAKKRSTQGAKCTKSGASQNVATRSGPQELLINAYHLISTTSAVSTNLSASDIVHDMQKLFNRLSILSNAIGIPVNYSAAKIVHDSLSSKDAMLCRERFMIETDRTTADRTALHQWPLTPLSESLAKNESMLLDGVIESTNFDDLPETWSIVSISLSDDRSEFLLSRIAAGQTPFLLRIPLCRSAIEDADDGEFRFDDAKEDLVDIITKANLTAHDSRSQADKATRKTWWSEREALDHRLEALLTNMENIWLGGFRGIVSQQLRSDQALISRFSSSLSSSLDNHLPSRQKTGSSTKKNVQLHAHVLDLFIALGHPDNNELDDAITDLLYFVVDIHQFEGEHNAYDEIDFDAILVDILDALRSYHEASTTDSGSQHTILILDKELHAFPWESLPCLLNKSVSRMPSLSYIRERLAKIRAQSPIATAYTIATSNGAYILNPGSDLPATESSFSEIFIAQLPTFSPSSITARRPTEEEFESLLQSKDLLLYFGHGSGAQYIRGRRIKQLDRCAVTFLMGCSSGKMTECGVYESYGVPWNYMHAGSMAVVGTLWDVTDRDIDRFAGKVLAEWGLIEDIVEGKSDEKARKMKIRMGRKVPNGKEVKKNVKGVVTLDEAVVRARDACILRYLNGAAVVMYGLPTVLE